MERFALASRYPYVSNSVWVEDVVGRRIAAIAATLPPQVVSAAQARGRSRDLRMTVMELAKEVDKEEEHLQ